MPPIMGATAFILAAYSGVPYVEVAIASLIPALLYFGGLFWFIHLEAYKAGLVGMPVEDKPSVTKVLLKGGHAQGSLLEDRLPLRRRLLTKRRRQFGKKCHALLGTEEQGHVFRVLL